jgi:hypothetical protein
VERAASRRSGALRFAKLAITALPDVGLATKKRYLESYFLSISGRFISKYDVKKDSGRKMMLTAVRTTTGLNCTPGLFRFSDGKVVLLCGYSARRDDDLVLLKYYKLKEEVDLSSPLAL